MLKKIHLYCLIFAIASISSPSFAVPDVVIYGDSLKDDYPERLKSWEVISCASPDECNRLTDPMANCRVRKKSIRCGAFTYHCDSGVAWRVIDQGYNANYFCTIRQPLRLPATPVGESNF